MNQSCFLRHLWSGPFLPALGKKGPHASGMCLGRSGKWMHASDAPKLYLPGHCSIFRAARQVSLHQTSPLKYGSPAPRDCNFLDPQLAPESSRDNDIPSPRNLELRFREGGSLSCQNWPWCNTVSQCRLSWLLRLPYWGNHFEATISDCHWQASEKPG